MTLDDLREYSRRAVAGRQPPWTGWKWQAGVARYAHFCVRNQAICQKRFYIGGAFLPRGEEYARSTYCRRCRRFLEQRCRGEGSDR